MNQKIAIFGAGKGLGLQILKDLKSQSPATSALIFSRNFSAEAEMAGVQFQKTDLSKESDVQQSLDKLDDFQPDRVWYIAGGGPYGNFQDREWKDHQWCFQVNFLSPMRILHHLLQKEKNNQSTASQFIAVGSLIAETEAEPKGSSYAASKVALNKMLQSTWANQQESPSRSKMDIRLFSPSYIDTGMIPAKASVRALKPNQIMTLPFTSQKFLEWGLHNAPLDRHYRLSLEQG